MPAFTTRLGMYIPGGGSLGLGGDDEVADIDRINQGLLRLDEVVGVPELSTFPGDPFPGQVVSVSGDTYYWSDSLGQWRQLSPHVGTIPPENPQEGYVWIDTN